jgi:hypothetical protein
MPAGEASGCSRPQTNDDRIVEHAHADERAGGAVGGSVRLKTKSSAPVDNIGNSLSLVSSRNADLHVRRRRLICSASSGASTGRTVATAPSRIVPESAAAERIDLVPGLFELQQDLARALQQAASPCRR